MADTQTTKPPILSARPEMTRTIIYETRPEQVMICTLVHQFLPAELAIGPPIWNGWCRFGLRSR